MTVRTRKKPHIRKLLQRLTLLLVLVVLSIALLVQLMHRQSSALTRHSAQDLLPKIYEHQRLALNLERLERMGDLVVYASSPILIRRNALSAQVLAYQPSLRQHPLARDTARAVYELLREMRKVRQQLIASDTLSAAERRNLQQLELALQERWNGYKQTLFTLQNRLISEATALQQQNLRQISATNNRTLLVAWGGIGLLILLILLIGSKLNKHLIRPVTRASQALTDLDQGRGSARLDARYQELDNIHQAVHNLSHTMEELHRMATRDFLTGCINRRHFMSLAQKALGDAVRSTQPLSLVMLDIDHFKKVNDNFGHAVGDQTLIHCCQWIRSALPEKQDGILLARLGGEEFALLLPDTATEEAAGLAETIRATVQCRARADKNLPAITISLGLHSLQNADDSIDHLLSQADAALYLAKASGRNQLAISPAGNNNTGTPSSQEAVC